MTTTTDEPADADALVRLKAGMEWLLLTVPIAAILIAGGVAFTYTQPTYFVTPTLEGMRNNDVWDRGRHYRLPPTPIYREPTEEQLAWRDKNRRSVLLNNLTIVPLAFLVACVGLVRGVIMATRDAIKGDTASKSSKVWRRATYASAACIWLLSFGIAVSLTPLSYYEWMPRVARLTIIFACVSLVPISIAVLAMAAYFRRLGQYLAAPRLETHTRWMFVASIVCVAVAAAVALSTLCWTVFSISTGTTIHDMAWWPKNLYVAALFSTVGLAAILFAWWCILIVAFRRQFTVAALNLQ